MGNGSSAGQQNALTTAVKIALWLGIPILLLSFFGPQIVDKMHKKATDTPLPVTFTAAATITTITPSLTTTIDPIFTPTLPPDITATPTITITPTIDPTLVAAPSFFPSPGPAAIGTNLPESFAVGPWHDNSCDTLRQRFTVKINGVDISGADPSGDLPQYSVTLWQYSKIFIPALNVTVDTQTQKTVVRFVEPIEVRKGRYVHVRISFHRTKGDVRWDDDLYYPRGINGSCP